MESKAHEVRFELVGQRWDEVGRPSLLLQLEGDFRAGCEQRQAVGVHHLRLIDGAEAALSDVLHAVHLHDALVGGAARDSGGLAHTDLHMAVLQIRHLRALGRPLTRWHLCSVHLSVSESTNARRDLRKAYEHN